MPLSPMAARARAERLAPYTQFRSLSGQRGPHLRRLAASRLHSEGGKVMRELPRTLPDAAGLVSLTATATPNVSVGGGGGEGGEGGGGSGLRGAVPGPALELSGCADRQEAVAGFITALKDIEG